MPRTKSLQPSESIDEGPLADEIINVIRTDDNKTTWKDQAIAFKQLSFQVAQICENSPEKVKPLVVQLRHLAPHLAKFIGNLRSSLVREVCLTLEKLAEALGPSFLSAVDTHVIPALLKRMSTTKAIIRDSSEDAASALFRYGRTGISEPVAKLLLHTMSDRKTNATAVRNSTANFVGMFFDDPENPPREIIMNYLTRAIVHGVEDPDEGVRAQSRSNWEKLASMNELIASQLLLQMPESVSKTLSDHFEDRHARRISQAPQTPMDKDTDDDNQLKIEHGGRVWKLPQRNPNRAQSTTTSQQQEQEKEQQEQPVAAPSSLLPQPAITAAPVIAATSSASHLNHPMSARGNSMFDINAPTSTSSQNAPTSVPVIRFPVRNIAPIVPSLPTNTLGSIDKPSNNWRTMNLRPPRRSAAVTAMTKIHNDAISSQRRTNNNNAQSQRMPRRSIAAGGLTAATSAHTIVEKVKRASDFPVMKSTSPSSSTTTSDTSAGHDGELDTKSDSPPPGSVSLEDVESEHQTPPQNSQNQGLLSHVSGVNITPKSGSSHRLSARGRINLSPLIPNTPDSPVGRLSAGEIGLSVALSEDNSFHDLDFHTKSKRGISAPNLDATPAAQTISPVDTVQPQRPQQLTFDNLDDDEVQKHSPGQIVFSTARYSTSPTNAVPSVALTEKIEDVKNNDTNDEVPEASQKIDANIGVAGDKDAGTDSIAALAEGNEKVADNTAKSTEEQTEVSRESSMPDKKLPEKSDDKGVPESTDSDNEPVPTLAPASSLSKITKAGLQEDSSMSSLKSFGKSSGTVSSKLGSKTSQRLPRSGTIPTRKTTGPLSTNKTTNSTATATQRAPRSGTIPTAKKAGPLPTTKNTNPTRTTTRRRPTTALPPSGKPKTGETSAATRAKSAVLQRRATVATGLVKKNVNGTAVTNKGIGGGSTSTVQKPVSDVPPTKNSTATARRTVRASSAIGSIFNANSNGVAKKEKALTSNTKEARIGAISRTKSNPALQGRPPTSTQKQLRKPLAVVTKSGSGNSSEPAPEEMTPLVALKASMSKLSLMFSRGRGDWRSRLEKMKEMMSSLEVIDPKDLSASIVEECVTIVGEAMNDSHHKMCVIAFDCLFLLLLRVKGEEESNALQKLIEKRIDMLRRVLQACKDSKEDVRLAAQRVLTSFEVCQFTPEVQVGLLLRAMGIGPMSAKSSSTNNSNSTVKKTAINHFAGGNGDVRALQIGCEAVKKSLDRAEACDGGFVWSGAMLERILKGMLKLSKDRRIEVRQGASSVVEAISESLPEGAFELACKKFKVEFPAHIVGK